MSVNARRIYIIIYVHNQKPTDGRTHPQLVAHVGEVELRGPHRVDARLQSDACFVCLFFAFIERWRREDLSINLRTTVQKRTLHQKQQDADSPERRPSAAMRTAAPLLEGIECSGCANDPVSLPSLDRSMASHPS